MKLFGIWCKDANGNRGDWLRDKFVGAGIVAYTSRAVAARRAGILYGYKTYAEAKKADWCEVRPLNLTAPAK